MWYKSAYNVPEVSFGPSYNVVNGETRVRNWGLKNTYWMNETTGCTNLKIKWDDNEIVELWTSTDGKKFNLAYGPCPCCEEEIRSHCTCSDDARAGRTRVIYRIDRETGEFLAVMPEVDAGAWGSVQVYAESWIAGMSPRAVMLTTRRASPSEIEAHASLISYIERDGYKLRRITYAQLLSDDCNGGIGPHDYAKDLYDVGCGWAEGYGYVGMHTREARAYWNELRATHMHKMKNPSAYYARMTK